jgi:hypothetical protein
VLQKIVNVSGIIVVLALAIWPFIQIVPERYAATGNSGAWPTVDEPQACLLDKPGYLSVETYGSLVSKLELKGDKLRCIGKLDALNSRSRLAFFTEPDSAGTNLVFVIGLEGVDEQLNQPGVPSNLTILDQSNGLFFSTQGVDRCWTDLTLTQLNSHKAPTYRAEGELYCSSAIAQIQGPGSISIINFNFAGGLATNYSVAAEMGIPDQ